jgi:hypothetical protein
VQGGRGCAIIGAHKDSKLQRGLDEENEWMMITRDMDSSDLGWDL